MSFSQSDFTQEIGKTIAVILVVGRTYGANPVQIEDALIGVDYAHIVGTLDAAVKLDIMWRQSDGQETVFRLTPQGWVLYGAIEFVIKVIGAKRG